MRSHRGIVGDSLSLWPILSTLTLTLHPSVAALGMIYCDFVSTGFPPPLPVHFFKHHHGSSSSKQPETYSIPFCLYKARSRQSLLLLRRRPFNQRDIYSPSSSSSSQRTQCGCTLVILCVCVANSPRDGWMDGRLLGRISYFRIVVEPLLL